MHNNIGEARRIYSLATGKKVNQADAAKMFGVALSTYRDWEQGKGKLNGEILCAMADKYDCSVDYLLCRTEDPRPYPGSTQMVYAHYFSRANKAVDDAADALGGAMRGVL